MSISCALRSVRRMPVFRSVNAPVGRKGAGVITDMLLGGWQSSPPALGPYTPVVRAGSMIFVSAQVGVDPGDHQVPAGDFEVECRQAFANLINAVRAGGGEPDDIVKVTVLYTSLADLPAVNAVF